MTNVKRPKKNRISSERRGATRAFRAGAACLTLLVLAATAGGCAVAAGAAAGAGAGYVAGHEAADDD